MVLLVVLGKFAWKPLLNGLNARQSHIEQQLKSAEDSRVKAEHLLDDYKQQGLSVVRQATEQAQRHQQQMAEKTREETLAIRRRAHEEIESARATAVEDLWKQTGDIVLQVGSEVLGRTLTEQDNQRLIDEAVARIRQERGSAMSNGTRNPDRRSLRPEPAGSGRPVRRRGHRGRRTWRRYPPCWSGSRVSRRFWLPRTSRSRPNGT